MINIDEIKDYINGLNYYRSFDEIDFSKFGKLNFEFKDTIMTDEHRWYIVETNVYEISKDGVVLGCLAIDEVGTLKSESMCIEDCYVKVRAYNVERIMKPSYVIINAEVKDDENGN